MPAPRVSLVCGLIAVVAFAAAPAVGDATFPELDVYTYQQSVGKATDLDLDLITILFKKKTAKPPRYVSSHVFTYYSLACGAGTTAPGGCKSETIDGS